MLSLASRLETDLRAKSFVHLRDFLPMETRETYALLQAAIDEDVRETRLDGHAHAGALNPTARIGEVMARAIGYEGNLEAFYWQLFEEPVLPLLRQVSPDFKRTDYAGVFVADPALPPSTNFYWHSDGHFDGLDYFGVNFWIPLADCGRDAPGLKMLEAEEHALKDRLSLLPQTEQGQFFTSVAWSQVQDAHLEQAFGPGRITTPEIRLGDVIVFTNRHIHKTHMDGAMTRGRAASIVRYSVQT